MKRSNCRSCGAPIIWTVTTRGRNMPVDAEPVVGGNIVLDTYGAPDKTPEARVVVDELGQETPRYVSHFATCPNASKHRRKR